MSLQWVDYIIGASDKSRICFFARAGKKQHRLSFEAFQSVIDLGQSITFLAYELVVPVISHDGHSRGAPDLRSLNLTDTLKSPAYGRVQFWLSTRYQGVARHCYKYR